MMDLSFSSVTRNSSVLISTSYFSSQIIFQKVGRLEKPLRSLIWLTVYVNFRDKDSKEFSPQMMTMAPVRRNVITLNTWKSKSCIFSYLLSFLVIFIKHCVLNDFQFFLIFIFRSTRELHTIFLLFLYFIHPFVFHICFGEIIKFQRYFSIDI